MTEISFYPTGSGKCKNEHCVLEYCDNQYCIDDLLLKELDRNPIGAMLLDAKLRLSWVNASFAAMLGFSIQELVGHSIEEITVKEDDQSLHNLELLRKGTISEFSVPKTYRHRDGHVVRCLTSVNGIYNEEGVFIRAQAFVHDVTALASILDAYEESDVKLRSTLQMARMGTWDWRTSNFKIAWSDEIYRILDLKPEDLGTTIYDFIDIVHPEDKKLVLKILSRSKGVLVDKPFEFRILTPSGKVKHLVAAGSSATPHNNNRQFGFLQDITELKEAQAELRGAYGAIANSITPIVTADLNGKLNYLNAAAKKMWGIGNKKKLEGYHLQDLFCESAQETIREVLNTIVAKRSFKNYDGIMAKNKKGEPFPVLLSASLIKGTIGEKRGITISLEDISALKAAERKARESDHQYSALVDEMTEGIVRLNSEDQILFCNTKFCDFFNVDQEKVKGKSLWELLDNVNLKSVNTDHLEFGFGTEFANNIHLNIGVGLDDLWISLNSVNLLDVDDAPNGRLVVITDITEQKLAEELLRENESKFRSINENSPDHIFIVDEDCRIHYVNKLYEGHSFRAMYGNSLAGLLPAEKAHQFSQYIERVYQTGRARDLEFEVEKEGKLHWSKVRMGPIKVFEQVSRVLVIISDITVQKEVEIIRENFTKRLEEKVIERTDALAKSEEQYRLIANNITDCVCLHDVDGNYHFVSPSSKDLLGYTPEELLGQSLFNRCSPDFHDELKSRFNRLLVDDNTVQIFEYQVRTKSDHLVWVESIFKPALQADGNVMFQSTTRNITERKQAEQDVRHALQSERELSVLKSKFLATASHQFRTPLAVIQSNMELMDLFYSKEELSSELKQRYNKVSVRIAQEVERMTDLMDDLLILEKINSKSHSVQPKLINVEDVIREEASKVQQIQEDDRKVVLEVAGTMRLVYADPKLFIHIVMNLLTNAFKYSKGSQAPKVLIHYEVDFLNIHVIDAGIGIPEDEVHNLFQPFYRANNTDGIQGTGLGLAIIKEYVGLMNGSISLETTVGKGSEFIVKLPYQS